MQGVGCLRAICFSRGQFTNPSSLTSPSNTTSQFSPHRISGALSRSEKRFLRRWFGQPRLWSQAKWLSDAVIPRLKGFSRMDDGTLGFLPGQTKRARSLSTENTFGSMEPGREKADTSRARNQRWVSLGSAAHLSLLFVTH